MRSYTNFAENAGAGAEASRHYSMETVQNIGFWYINMKKTESGCLYNGCHTAQVPPSNYTFAWSEVKCEFGMDHEQDEVDMECYNAINGRCRGAKTLAVMSITLNGAALIMLLGVFYQRKGGNVGASFAFTVTVAACCAVLASEWRLTGRRAL